MNVTPTQDQLPALDDIHKKPIAKQLQDLLETNRAKLSALLNQVDQCKPFDPMQWDYMRQLESIEANVSDFWGPIDHMQSVAQTDTLRQAHQSGLALITQWGTELEQNEQLYQWIKKWSEHSDFEGLDDAQKKVIENSLRAFHLSGINLSLEKQQRYKSVQMQLAKYSAQFESNIVDSSREGSILVQDPAQLAGLSERVIAAAHKTAELQKKTGWLFTINGPNFQAIMTCAEDRALRKEFYTAWVTRACETTSFDNSDLMYQILRKRYEISQLTQFSSYAERSLASDKMAKTPQEVIDFLNTLLEKTRPRAEQDLQKLQDFANTQGHLGSLCDWDLGYFSEKLRQQTFSIQEEKLRAYFPLPHVLAEFLKLLNEQFQINIQEITPFKAWDPEVKVLAIRDNAQQIRGYLYLDLYTRSNKRSGAWVREYTQRRLREDQCLQLPIGFLTCNFAPPSPNEPALLTHNDVITLFHEMGHALHHTLTQVDYASISGIEGVPWDGVEFPSQLLEKFASEPLVLERISAHYQTGESLPKEQIEALQQSHYFQAGLQLIRQLEFSLFDFQLHLQFDPTKGPEQIQEVLDTIRKKTRLLPTPPFNRFQHSFAHIFSGGYGAGYYSYLWAEVLAADAFSRFREEGLTQGILNPETGRDFMQTVLELGGSVDILELFKRFRKREVDVKAFLRQRGVLPAEVL